MKLIALNDSFGQFKLQSFTKPRIIRSEILKKRFHKLNHQWMESAKRILLSLKGFNDEANRLLGTSVLPKKPRKKYLYLQRYFHYQ